MRRFRSFEIIFQTRVGGLPPIFKHREELKIQGEAEYFLTEFCEKIKEKVGIIYVISSSDFQIFSTVLIFLNLLHELSMSLRINRIGKTFYGQ